MRLCGTCVSQQIFACSAPPRYRLPFSSLSTRRIRPNVAIFSFIELWQT
jgi:hypothetical protein